MRNEEQLSRIVYLSSFLPLPAQFSQFPNSRDIHHGCPSPPSLFLSDSQYLQWQTKGSCDWWHEFPWLSGFIWSRLRGMMQIDVTPRGEKDENNLLEEGLEVSGDRLILEWQDSRLWDPVRITKRHLQTQWIIRTQTCDLSVLRTILFTRHLVLLCPHPCLRLSALPLPLAPPVNARIFSLCDSRLSTDDSWGSLVVPYMCSRINA